MSNVEKVCIYPCNGIGGVFSTITRNAAYIIVDEMLKDKSTLLCLPALMRGVEEDIDMLEKYPTIVIEGCSQHCALNMLRVLGIKPHAMYFLPEISKSYGLKPGNSRKDLSENGIALANKVAQIVVEEAHKMMNHPHFMYQEQTLKRIHEDLLDPTIDVYTTLNFEQREKGFHRPKKVSSCGCCGQK